MEKTQFAIPEMFYDRGGFDQAGPCALRLMAQKVFLLSEPGVEAAVWVKRLTGILKKEGIEWVSYPCVATNSRDESLVERGVEAYLENGADVVMAIGNDNALDAAKSIAVMVSNGGKIGDYDGVNSFRCPLPPMMFITTTTGSDLDFSTSCIISGWPRLQYIPILPPFLVRPVLERVN